MKCIITAEVDVPNVCIKHDQPDIALDITVTGYDRKGRPVPLPVRNEDFIMVEEEATF